MTDTETTGRVLRPVGWTGPTGARVTAHLTGTVRMNNYRGRQAEWRTFELERIEWPAELDTAGILRGRMTYQVINGLDMIPKLPNPGFLIDDGHSVTPYYVAGYHLVHRYLSLHPENPGAGKFLSDGPTTYYWMTVEEVTT